MMRQFGFALGHGPLARGSWTAATLMLAIAGAGAAAAAPVVFQAGGSDDPASIQAAVDSFRAALGDPNNANAPGPLASGRREINWDGGGLTANSPGGTPFNVFLNTRGAQFIAPGGTGFVQAPASGGTDGGLEAFFTNATYGATFGFFSPVRLFVPVGSNTTEARFFVPGSAGAAPAEVSGFGAVFSDVDLADTTKIDYFDRSGNLLGEKVVPIGTTADKSLSFLGVVFDEGEKVFRVGITTGTDALGVGTNDNPADGVDLVALDDVLYSEPLAAIPEPASWTLLGLGAAALVAARGRVRRRTAP
jgi:hypothetical protein